MHHEDLLVALSSTGSFATTEDAQRALLNTLETLGYALPVALLRELSPTLPRSYASCLWRGPSSAEAARRLAHAQPAWDAMDVPPPILQEMHVVCAALAELLPAELVHRIAAALPKPLAHLFTRSTIPSGHHGLAARAPVEHVSKHQDRTGN